LNLFISFLACKYFLHSESYKKNQRLYNIFMIIKSENIILESKSGKNTSLDIRYSENFDSQDLIIFLHGFKGFKDWACFDLMADTFAEKGFIVLKMNFSHNGIDITNPYDFTDLEGFAKNTLSKELNDLQAVLNYVSSDDFFAKEKHNGKINLIGHSRGGVTALLGANIFQRIDKIVTWASPAYFQDRFTKEELAYWEKAGRIYVENSRTGQKMPMDYDIALDYLANKEKYLPSANAENLKIPFLIVHGTNDATVGLDSAYQLMNLSKTADLYIIRNADHSFGAKHPFEGKKLPKDFEKVIHTTSQFLK
jgi:uncharacterized protein